MILVLLVPYRFLYLSYHSIRHLNKYWSKQWNYQSKVTCNLRLLDLILKNSKRIKTLSWIYINLISFYKLRKMSKVSMILIVSKTFVKSKRNNCEKSFMEKNAGNNVLRSHWMMGWPNRQCAGYEILI